MAIEFVMTLAEASWECAPRMMRKPPQFVPKLIGVLMNLSLDIVDDPALHGAEIDDEDASDQISNYGFGQKWSIISLCKYKC